LLPRARAAGSKRQALRRRASPRIGAQRLALVVRQHQRQLRSSSSHTPKKISERKPFVLTAEHVRAWGDLYGAADHGEALPFSYYAPLTMDTFHRSIHALRLSFRNVLHLQWVMEAQRPGGAALQPGVPYQLHTGLDDVSFLKGNRAVFTFFVNVFDGAGDPMVRNLYHFLVKNLSPRDIALLKSTQGYNQHEFPELMAVSRTGEVKALKGARTRSLHFTEDMGVRYGRVSGDMNIVHVNKWLVRLFGYSRPFAQGMCTANYVLKTLACDERASVDHFTITFCKPVFLPGTVKLALGDGQFQIRDESRLVVSVGTWRSRTPSALS
jgi:acyl dehydratase